MIAVASLLKMPAARWALAVFVAAAAVKTTSVVRYRAGVAEGKRVERAESSREIALARAVVDRNQIAADAIAQALRDTIAQRDQRIMELREKAALATGKYREALGWYLAGKAARDSTVPLTDEQIRCDAVVSSCANALAAEGAVKDSLTRQLRTAERLVAVRDSSARLEPVRTSLALRDALAAQRAAFKAPSRTKWAAIGAGIGAAAAWWFSR
jgi:hypothetical protein